MKERPFGEPDPYKHTRERHVASLTTVLLCVLLLLAGCASVPVAKVRLPEPPVPVCLVEEPKAKDEVVGRFEFEPGWVYKTLRQDTEKARMTEVFRCTSDVAKSLRESIAVIRTFNSK